LIGLIRLEAHDRQPVRGNSTSQRDSSRPGQVPQDHHFEKNPVRAGESRMKDHAGLSISIWMATATLPSFSKLLMNEQAHVCIVGAGIAGLTTAYLLGRAGKSVVVLDDGPIVSGETERTTAHPVRMEAKVTIGTIVADLVSVLPPASVAQQVTGYAHRDNNVSQGRELPVN